MRGYDAWKTGQSAVRCHRCGARHPEIDPCECDDVCEGCRHRDGGGDCDIPATQREFIGDECTAFEPIVREFRDEDVEEWT